MTEDVYDFIVVGAGAAGSALAGRLSERPDFSTLLLEAGGSDKHLWVRVPLGVGKLLSNPSILWQAATEPEPGLLGNRIEWASGRLLGGSTSVNGMLVVRGHRARYDEWARAAGSGWSAADVLPFFDQMETCGFGDARYRGKSGPISVEQAERHILGDAFIEACNAVGISPTDDYNGGDQEGASRFQMNVRHGVRCSAATGYIRPASGRPNLRVASHAPVHRVLFEGRRAVGVEYVESGVRRVARARREVILCAGAVRSPQLLELSGVGNGSVLARHGIPVVHELRGVGENLHDHLMVRICFSSRNATTIYDLLSRKTVLLRELARYVFSRRGLFSTSSFPAIAFVRTRDGLPYPDARIQVGLTSGAKRLSKNTNSGLDPHSGFHVGGYPIYPESRGSVHIRSTDPLTAPTINANYLSAPEDCATTVRVLRVLRDIARQPQLSPFIVDEVRPGKEVTSDDALLEYARRNGDTCWHPTGSCQMGSGGDAVVDTELRVHGLDGLRVADASVFTSMIASNTNFPTMMVGERAAGFIRSTYQ